MPRTKPPKRPDEASNQVRSTHPEPTTTQRLVLEARLAIQLLGNIGWTINDLIDLDEGKVYKEFMESLNCDERLAMHAAEIAVVGSTMFPFVGGVESDMWPAVREAYEQASKIYEMEDVKPKPEREWSDETKAHFAAILDTLYEFCSDSDIDSLSKEEVLKQYGLWLTGVPE